jgi:hypothetical protein
MVDNISALVDGWVCGEKVCQVWGMNSDLNIGTQLKIPVLGKIPFEIF